jgi:hypothetical protein
VTVFASRFAAQLLSGPAARSPEAVVDRLLAVQAQDPRGARLAIRARSQGLHASDVDRALTEDRSLLVSWLNRGTLHLVLVEDYPWLHALTAPRLATGIARRLAQEGVSAAEAERAVDAIVRTLARDGPSVRALLRDAVAGAGVRVEGQAIVQVLALASQRGLIVRGPVVGSEQAFVLTHDWIGEPPAVDREQAAQHLALRYLAGHGPADAADLARWAGIALGEARAALRAAAPQLVERADGLLERRPARRVTRLPALRLLGAFDPVLLGWTSREPILGEHTGLVTVNGLFRPFVLAGGRAVATWGLPSGEVVVESLPGEDPPDAGALRREAARVVRFLGLARGRGRRASTGLGQTPLHGRSG